MKIHHLYTDEKGDSHFEDMEVEYVETTPAGRFTKRLRRLELSSAKFSPLITWTGTTPHAGSISSISTTACRSPPVMAKTALSVRVKSSWLKTPRVKATSVKPSTSACATASL